MTLITRNTTTFDVVSL